MTEQAKQKKYIKTKFLQRFQNTFTGKEDILFPSTQLPI